MNESSAMLSADEQAIAARVIWAATGDTPPTGADLIRAARNLETALAAGRAIPRHADKTVRPMCGARRDLEQRDSEAELHE